MIVIVHGATSEMGIKEPLEQTDITSGICEPCFNRVMAEIKQMHEKKEVKNNEGD